MRSWALHVEKVSGPAPLGVGTVVPVTASLTVGRSPEADLVLADDRISRLHATLSVREDGLWIEPVGSGATYLGGARLTEDTRLSDGDWLQLGGVLFKVAERALPALLVIDPDGARAWLAGRLLDLQPSPYRVLEALAEAPGEWLDDEHLAGAVWRDDPEWGNPAYINKYVSYVRRALKDVLSEEEPALQAAAEAVRSAGEGVSEARLSDPQKLPLELVKARKKVGFRLQVPPAAIAWLPGGP